MRPVFLIGFMASGKTTLGSALGAALPGLSFVDLDAAIEEETGRTISEIFATAGEDAFRILESDALRRYAIDGTIVACGGGTPCRTENMDFMLSAGTVVWLRADTDTTVRRLLLAPEGQRPIISRLSRDPALLKTAIEEMEASRKPHYSRAHDVFDSSHLETVGEVAAAVDKFIERFNLK